MKTALVLLFAFATSTLFSQQIFKKKQNLLGSPFEITVVASDSIQGYYYTDLATAEVKRIENLISDWIPTTQISKVNQNNFTILPAQKTDFLNDDDDDVLPF